LNIGKVLLLAKQTQVYAEKRVGRHRSDTNIHEETGNAASNLCWQSGQNLCSIVRKLQMFME